MEKLPGHAALSCRVQALGGGWLNVIIHTRDGGFAEEAVLVVHQVLIDAGSRTDTKKKPVHISSQEECKYLKKLSFSVHLYVSASGKWRY